MVFKISYIGGKQAGIIGLLTTLASRNDIISVTSYSIEVTELSNKFQIPTFATIKNNGFKDKVRESDFLFCVHGREKVPQDIINLTKQKIAINIHPYLYKYKGIDPVNRALKDKCYLASVGSHYMTNNYDEGEVIDEQFIDVTGSNTPIEVYNKLYPLYSMVILNTLNKLTF